ncbi:MAG: metallophosphoesterase [bacterium]
MTWENIASALLFAAAGMGLLVIVANRWLIDMREGWHKLPLIGLVGAGLTLAPATAGFVAGDTWWTVAPVLVLGGIAAGETHRAWLRRRFRGAAPVERHNHGVALARPVTTTDLAVARFEIELPDWHDTHLRIAHISDLHVNDALPRAFYLEMWQRVAAAAPDLLLITGDFINHAEEIPILDEVLAARPRGMRTFAVFGNHDYWSAPDQVRASLARADIDVLGNGHRRLAREGHPCVIIAGCEDPWSPSRWSPAVKKRGDALLVLSHTADNIYPLNRAGADAVFSGHYHAGQVRIPRLGSLVVPSLFGRRFDHGHFNVNGTHLFVTAGIGSAPALRIYCQPDLFVVDIMGRGSDE